MTLGTYIYDQPESLWGDKKSLDGAAYYITAITDGYPDSYDKQSYITAYYDADTAQASLGVSTNGLYVADYVWVMDRTTSWEGGYATQSANQASHFTPYTEADVSVAASVPAAAPAASPSTSPTALTVTGVADSAASSQAVWTAYWSRSLNLEEEQD